MPSGIPVRLSAELARRARTAAETSDRSVTEQVEHWARLGQAVEDVALAKTVERLKTRSHDPALADRIAFASTPEGRAKAIDLIKSRNAAPKGLDARARTTRTEVTRARPGATSNAAPQRVDTRARAGSAPRKAARTAAPARRRAR